PTVPTRRSADLAGGGARRRRPAGGGRRAGVPAEPAAHRRHRDLGHGLRPRARGPHRRAQRAGRLRTARPRPGLAPGARPAPARRRARHPPLHPAGGAHPGRPHPRGVHHPGSAMTALLDIHLTVADADAALRADARAGLTAHPKHLPPTWFYDARGSALFERITELPEYFPTRTERALLERTADAIAITSGGDTIVELGSGSSAKTRLLLDAFRRARSLRRYVPQDVSEPALREAMSALAADYPGLQL